MRRFYEFVIELLFPERPAIAALENLSPDKFSEALAPPTSPQKEHEALFDYRSEPAHSAIRELKYRGNAKIARQFSYALLEFILDRQTADITFKDSECPLIVPVPLHSRRRRQRGFNQCELVCAELAKICAGAFEIDMHILAKNRDTPHQSESSTRSERLTNLKGSFSVNNPKLVFSREVIVIDDVVTTGATFNEIAATLKGAGARKVTCIALAH